jgi:hypothetical protein
MFIRWVEDAGNGVYLKLKKNRVGEKVTVVSSSAV